MDLASEINLAGVLWPPVILVGMIFLFILLKRKALRDITKQAKFPEIIQWPVAPEEQLRLMVQHI
jgi:hypothetical protein